jgi:hypothetical protein
MISAISPDVNEDEAAEPAIEIVDIIDDDEILSES